MGDKLPGTIILWLSASFPIAGFVIAGRTSQLEKNQWKGNNLLLENVIAKKPNSNFRLEDPIGCFFGTIFPHLFWRIKAGREGMRYRWRIASGTNDQGFFLLPETDRRLILNRRCWQRFASVFGTPDLLGKCFALRMDGFIVNLMEIPVSSTPGTAFGLPHWHLYVWLWDGAYRLISIPEVAPQITLN